jgi:hypothetical protein
MSGRFGLGWIGVLAAALTFAVTARADGEYGVTTPGGNVVVTAQGAWHVNAGYPWKYTVGDKSFDATAFKFTDTTATLTAPPKGTGTLKGGVCAADGGSCKSFTATVKP